MRSLRIASPGAWPASAAAKRTSSIAIIRRRSSTMPKQLFESLPSCPLIDPKIVDKTVGAFLDEHAQIMLLIPASLPIHAGSIRKL